MINHELSQDCSCAVYYMLKEDGYFKHFDSYKQAHDFAINLDKEAHHISVHLHNGIFKKIKRRQE